MSNYNFVINIIEISVFFFMFLYTLIIYTLIISIKIKMFVYNHVMLLDKINKCIDLVHIKQQYIKQQYKKNNNYLMSNYNFVINHIKSAITHLKTLILTISFFFDVVYYFNTWGLTKLFFNILSNYNFVINNKKNCLILFHKTFYCSMFYNLIILIIIKKLAYKHLMLIVKNKIAKLGDVIIICVNSINIKKYKYIKKCV